MKKRWNAVACGVLVPNQSAVILSTNAKRCYVWTIYETAGSLLYKSNKAERHELELVSLKNLSSSVRMEGISDF